MPDVRNSTTQVASAGVCWFYRYIVWLTRSTEILFYIIIPYIKKKEKRGKGKKLKYLLIKIKCFPLPLW